ncbi:MAG: hypothetical protein AAF330_04645, partial [Pseudomonadota bacterium]
QSGGVCGRCGFPRWASLRPIALFMSRHFHWQPSEIDALEVEDLLADYEEAAKYLESERAAQ